jgi:outer membrane protein assembly factor BamD
MKPLRTALAIAGAALALSACGGKDLELMTSEENARQLYERASKAMKSARHDQAIRIFRQLESRYPFSPYALQAQLDLAYSYFLFSQPERAVTEADRFIRFNPTHPNVDYAYYIKGVANSGNKRFLMSWFPRNPAAFEKQPLEDAFTAFSQLVNRFPDSPYVPDARQRMIYLRNILAEHEISVARFYMEKQAWVAAANRANYVLENFAKTPSNRDALEILVEAYENLDLPDAAADARRVLEVNFPGRGQVAESQAEEEKTS